MPVNPNAPIGILDGNVKSSDTAWNARMSVTLIEKYFN